MQLDAAIDPVSGMYMSHRKDKVTRSNRCSQCPGFILVWLTVLNLLGQHLASSELTGRRCKAGHSHSTCVCDTPEGTIDLNVLSSSDETSARFTAIKDAAASCMYSYNPCRAFQSDVCKSKVYLCAESGSGDDHDVANDGTEQMWIDTDGTVYLYYTGPNNIKKTRVNLHCDRTHKDPYITTDGDSASTHIYVFDITGCDVCPGGCDGHGGGGGSGGGGRIRLIGWAGVAVISVLIACVVTYFVVGALIMKFHFKAAGTDIIPNKRVWFALPSLLKDGCVFTVSPCVALVRRKSQEKKGYREIQ